MISVGEQLRAAREARGLTAAQVAEATRMKVQTVDLLERNEFQKIGVAVYGKGFIRMYAEAVGLDHGPLVEEYIRSMASAPEASSGPSAPAPARAEAEAIVAERVKRSAQEPAAPRRRTPTLAIPELDWRAAGASWGGAVADMARAVLGRLKSIRWRRPAPFRTSRRLAGLLSDVRSSEVLKYAGIALGGVVLVIVIVTTVRRCNASDNAAALQTYGARDPLRLTHEPPAPYLDAKRGP